MVNRAVYVEHAECRFESDDSHLTTPGGKLLLAFGVEPVEALVTDRDLGVAVQLHRAALRDLAATRTLHGRQARTGSCWQQQSDFPQGTTTTPESTMHPQSAQPISMRTRY